MPGVRLTLEEREEIALRNDPERGRSESWPSGLDGRVGGRP